MYRKIRQDGGASPASEWSHADDVADRVLAGQQEQHRKSIRSLDNTVAMLAVLTVGAAFIPGIGIFILLIAALPCLFITILGVILLAKGAAIRGIFALLLAFIGLPLLVTAIPLIRSSGGLKEPKAYVAQMRQKWEEALRQVQRGHLGQGTGGVSLPTLPGVRDLPGMDVLADALPDAPGFGGSLNIQDIEIVEVHLEKAAGPQGRPAFVTRVDWKNNSMRPVNRLKATVKLYDDYGVIQGNEVFLYEGTPVLPGETVIAPPGKGHLYVPVPGLLGSPKRSEVELVSAE